MPDIVDKAREMVNKAKGLHDKIAIDVIRETGKCPNDEKKAVPDDPHCIRCWKSFLTSGVSLACRKEV